MTQVKLTDPITKLEVGGRIVNCVCHTLGVDIWSGSRAANMPTVAQLLTLKPSMLLRGANFGRKSLTELEAALRQHIGNDRLPQNWRSEPPAPPRPRPRKGDAKRIREAAYDLLAALEALLSEAEDVFNCMADATGIDRTNYPQPFIDARAVLKRAREG